MQGVPYRLLRTQAFQVWHEAVSAEGVVSLVGESVSFHFQHGKLTIPFWGIMGVMFGPHVLSCFSFCQMVGRVNGILPRK